MSIGETLENLPEPPSRQAVAQAIKVLLLFNYYSVFINSLKFIGFTSTGCHRRGREPYKCWTFDGENTVGASSSQNGVDGHLAWLP